MAGARRRWAPIRVAHALTAPLAAAVFLIACGEDAPGPPPWRQQDLLRLAGEEARTSYVAQGRLARALAGPTGATLRFRLELGETPRLRFRPGVRPERACRFEVHVTTEEAGFPVRERVHLSMHQSSGTTLPEFIDVDLGPWAGQSIALELATHDIERTRCRGLWISPVVVDRSRDTAVRGRAAGRPNVLLLTTDTLRADALGPWGRERSWSRGLDRFAATSDVWLDAYSSINNTNPSFASLMTGLYVKNHGIFNLRSGLAHEHTTLAEHLAEAGYATRAVVSVAHLRRSGLQQGFDEFTAPDEQFFAEAVVDEAIDWLQQPDDAPYFLWLHFFDVHIPHNPPAPFARGLAPTVPSGMSAVASWEAFRSGGIPSLRRPGNGEREGHPKLYASEVAYLDHQLDRLLDFVDSHGAADDTIVVLVSDHGETLGERARYYGHSGLYAETTHVPLIIRWPGQEQGREVRGLVQHFDIFPTLLRALDLDVPEQDGLDLLGGDGGTPRDAVFANHANDRGSMLRTGDWLYLIERDVPGAPRGPKFYDLASDPTARTNLIGEGRPDEAEARARLDAWKRDVQRKAEPVEGRITREELEQLEALGYLE